nr:MAG TPA: tail protein [Caudoviricetes sp.]
MITFLDEKDNEYNAQVAYSTTSSVNGELSIKGTIYTNQKVLHGIDRGWRLRLDDEYYRIIYAKPNDTGRQIEVEFDAVHQFFYDMSKMSLYETLEGSKPIRTYLDAIFKGTSYRYVLEVEVGSIRKENFGNKSRLNLFNDLIKQANLEFSVSGHVVRILKNIGTDQSAIVRKNFNMNELTIEKDINSFVTYQRGLGMWKDEENHDLGRYEAVYESPLAQIYGRIEAEPVVDERYKETGKLLERLKTNVDNSYKVSISIDMEDLTKAGYKLSEPRAGDYIMAVNETLGLRKKIRIVSLISEYDVSGKLISRKVTCNDIGSVKRNSGEMNTLSRSVTNSLENSARALDVATQALTSADGKNTNYFGDKKPADIPKGTLKKGDRLFLTVGDKKVLYFWNGAEWELEPTEFDSDKFNAEFDRKAEAINKNIQQVDNKASEALTKADAIVDSQELLDKINAHLYSDANNDDNGILGKKFRLQREANRSTRNIATSTRDKLTDYQRTNDENLVRIGQQLDNTVSKAEMKQTADGIRETILELQTNGSGGPNMIRNSRADDGLQYWETQSVNFQSHVFYFNGQKRMFALTGVSWMKSPRFLLKKNTAYMLNFFGFNSRNTKSLRVYIRKRKKGETQDYTSEELLFNPTTIPFLSHVEAVKKSFKFNTGDFDEGYLYIFNGGPNNGSDKWSGVFLTEFDLYEGTTDRKWQPAPEDGAEWLNGKITTLDRTLDGIRATVTEAKSYIDADGQRRQEINQLIRDETAKGINTVLSTVEQSGYAKRTEIQSITETQKLYDRIIGTTEDGIKQNIARMTLTDSLFQTEVSKAIDKNFNSVNQVTDPYELANHQVDRFSALENFTLEQVKGSPYSKLCFTIKESGDRRLFIPLNNLPEDMRQFSYSVKIETTGNASVFAISLRGSTNTYWSLSKKVNGDIYSGTSSVLNSAQKVSPDLMITFGGTGSVKVSMPIVIDGTEPNANYEPNKLERLFTQSEKTNQTVRSMETLLNGSWSVKHLNSAGDIVGQVNLTDGDFRFVGKRFHITGETLIDNASIKSAAIESIEANKIRAGTLDAHLVNIINLNANSITAGAINGIDIRGSVFSGQNNEFVIDAKKNELLFNKYTLMTFYNKKTNNWSLISTGDRLGNGLGSGIVIASGVNPTLLNNLRNEPTDRRDLLTPLSKTDSYISLASNGTYSGVDIVTKTYFHARNNSGNPGACGIGFGDGDTRDKDSAYIYGYKTSVSGRNTLSLNGLQRLSMESKGQISIVGNDLEIIKGNKSLIAYFNGLAQLVKRVAEHAGWKNVTDYSI